MGSLDTAHVSLPAGSSPPLASSAGKCSVPSGGSQLTLEKGCARQSSPGFEYGGTRASVLPAQALSSDSGHILASSGLCPAVGGLSVRAHRIPDKALEPFPFRCAVVDPQL